MQKILKWNQYRYEMGKWRGSKLDNNAQRENRENTYEKKNSPAIRHERGE